jgi:hypothetical protein
MRDGDSAVGGWQKLAIGLPTMLERPTTTALRRTGPCRAPARSATWSRPAYGNESVSSSPGAELDIDEVEAIGTPCVRWSDDLARIDMSRERKLHQNAVDGRIGVEPPMIFTNCSGGFGRQGVLTSESRSSGAGFERRGLARGSMTMTTARPGFSALARQVSRQGLDLRTTSSATLFPSIPAMNHLQHCFTQDASHLNCSAHFHQIGERNPVRASDAVNSAAMCIRRPRI